MKEKILWLVKGYHRNIKGLENLSIERLVNLSHPEDREEINKIIKANAEPIADC